VPCVSRQILLQLLDVDFDPIDIMAVYDIVVRFEPNLVRMYETVKNTQSVSLVEIF